MTSRSGDLDADADSLTCRQSGLTCNDDRPKMVGFIYGKGGDCIVLITNK